MKSIAVLTLLISLSASGLSLAAKHDHEGDHRHEGSRGGVVVEVSDVDYELVAKPDLLQVYASDHGKAVDLSGASATATIYSGRDKQEVKLSGFSDRMEAKGDFKIAAGAKVVVVLDSKGKPARKIQFTVK